MELQMPSPMTAAEVLEREFLEIRAKILELAASFDRLHRSEGVVQGDPRVILIREALDVLATTDRGGRAEEIQLLFSRQYPDDWRRDYDLETV
jgi:hypothetical protein